MAFKSLHITNSWHATSGGIATFYRALIDEANRRQHQIRLIVPGDADRIENLGPCARIYHVKSRRAPLNSHYRMILPHQYLPAGSTLQQILAVERPDLIEICDKYTLPYFGALIRRGLLRSLNFRPIVIGLSCERMDDNFRSYVGRVPSSAAFCAAYMKWLYFPFFDHHIANSAYTAEELRVASRGHAIPRKVWIMPMGVDLARLSPERKSPEKRQQLLNLCGGREDSILLLYAGRLAPEKNLPLLFETFVSLVADGKRDYRLLIAGDGIERKTWESYCHGRTPKRATFLGHMRNQAELADLLANSDAFIHPNPREPFGIAPLEAMASGLPLVAPDCGGVVSYANTTNAWLAPPNTPSFCSTVERVFRDPLERIARTQKALAASAEYHWESIAPKFLDLYEELSATTEKNAGKFSPPAFSSTSLDGFQLAWFRGVSQGAEKLFTLAADFLSRSRP